MAIVFDNLFLFSSSTFKCDIWACLSNFWGSSITETYRDSQIPISSGCIKLIHIFNVYSYPIAMCTYHNFVEVKGLIKDNILLHFNPDLMCCYQEMILCNTHFLVYRYTQVFAVMLCNSARPEYSQELGLLVLFCVKICVQLYPIKLN